MSCKLPNFGKLDALGLPVEILEVQNASDMVKAIIENFDRTVPNYSLSEESSVNPEDFKLSIDRMTSQLEDLLDANAKNNKSLDLKRGGTDSQTIIENIKTHYYPKGKITRDEEVDLTAVIDGQLQSREEIASQRLSKVLDKFFAGNLPAKEYFKTHFARELGLTTVVRIGQTLKDSAIVDDLKSLNENIEKFLANQYLIVYRYLSSLGFAKGLPNSMFRQNKPIGTYINTLDRFYNLVILKSKIGTLEDEVEEGWALNVNGEGLGTSLFEAINAYLSIVYFDKLSKEAIGDYISADKDQEFPIYIDEDKQPHYKYRFGKDTENRVHGWQIDVRDALKEMGNFSKFLISSIPIDDTYLTPVNYLGAFTNLFGNISQLQGGSEKLLELYLAMATFNLDPVNKMREILTIINKYDSVRTALLKLKIVNPYEMKVFDAVYEYVFAGSNSLFNIEASYNRQKGLTNRYPLVESLAALIASSTEMSYLQTVYDYNAGLYVTEVKKKFQTNKQFYDMVRAINNNNLTMENVELGYKIISKSPSHYVIDLGKAILEVDIDLAENPYGILTKRANDNGIEIKVKAKDSSLEMGLESLFGSVDLSTKTKRQLLIDLRSEKGATFMNVLEFVDFFAGTGFTTTQDGLLEFELFKLNFAASPKEAVTTAIRGLVVRDIHDKFRQAVDNGQYNSSQIEKFIEDSKIYKDSILGLDPTDRDWRSIWEPSVLGPDLITIGMSQTWLNNYVIIKQIMSGEISKANTKNLAGDSVPNYGLSFMGTDLHTLLSDSQHKVDDFESQPLGHNLFMLNSGAIKGTVIDTDVRLADGTTKQVKRMTEGELFYHAMVDKFLIPLVLNENNKYMIIQPTTYSDKTKFVNYKIGLNFNGKDISLMTDSELETLYVGTIGESYRTVLRNVLSDYAQLFDMQDMFMLAYPADAEGLALEPNWQVVTLMVRQIDRRLATMDEYDLVALKNLKGLKSEILVDTHFRINGNRAFKDGRKKKKGLAFNESLLHYATVVYTKANIKERLNKERRRFVNQLLKNKMIVSGIRFVKGEPDPENIWVQALKYFGERPSSWITSDGTLILARVNDEPITAHDAIKEGDTLELNPVLNKFFLLHSLIGNNLRMALTGSEINHKNKHLGGIKPNMVITKALNPDNKSNVLSFQDPELAAAITTVATSKGIDAQDFWNTMSLTEAYEVIEAMPNSSNKRKAKRAIDDAMYEVESAGQGALLKRNVIIPATMRYYTLGSLRGIASTMRIAVMDDIPAPVFNFTGEEGSVDSHDGAAFINPITSILENWSLQENEVGTVKKPIWHYYDKQHMTSSLVKFAAHTMTNNMMQQSQGSTVSMLHMFKKMANKPWAFKGNILKVAAHKVSGEITLADLSGGNDLYYKGPEGVHYKIVDFGYDEENAVYYTDEIRVDDKGIGSKAIRKYHYFDALSNHRIYLTPQKQDTTLHTMSSIYEAHQIFGGINSESLVGDGNDRKLRYSEASNYVVANLVNNVTVLSPEFIAAQEKAKAEGKTPPKREFNQNIYEQPLKYLMIDYLCNNSAIKNGAGNRNSSSRFENDEDLDTITLGTEYYGIQMDADHEADEAEMTEFSQVISALDAGGRLHNYVKGIYQALGLIALEEASLEMESIEAYQLNPTDETRDALYDIIGRTIINNISTSRGQAGLAESIVTQIKKRFSLSNAHAMDDLKIPFSDANIYSNILSTFASIITNKSIRKKYPGLGAVLSPGYNIMMIYDIDGKQYQYKDLVKLATNAYKDYKKRTTEGKEDPEDKYFKPLAMLDADLLAAGYLISSEEWNKLVVEAYLMQKTDQYNALKWKYKVIEEPGKTPDWDLHTEEFMPTDNVGILVQNADDTQEWIDVALDKISDYYLFKADPRAFILDKLLRPVKILQFRKNVHKSRNLAPTKIWWEYKGKINGKPGNRVNNIFNSIHLLRKFAKSKGLSDEQRGRVNAYIERLIAQGVKEYSSTQELLDALDASKDITLYNTPAELIMSNIYQSRFGIEMDESMADVIAEGPKKTKKIRQVHQSVSPDFYDFVMMKSNGKHTYISLDRQFESTQPDEDGELPDVSYKHTFWKDKHRKEVRDGNVLNEVYATTKDHRLLFRVGRDIVRDDLAYSEEGKFFYVKDRGPSEKVEGKFTYTNGLVTEYVEFVTRHEITSKGKRHIVFNINYEELKRTIPQKDVKTPDGKILTGEDAYKYLIDSYVQGLIKEMYEADSYELLTINNQQLRLSNLGKVQRILEKYAKADEDGFSYNPQLSKYLEAISEQVSKIPNTKNFTRPDLLYDAESGAIFFVKAKEPGSIAKIIDDRTIAAKNSLNYKKYYSFLRSQYYTASRIPALTLLSFMNMRQIAYTAEGSNLAYVSHWQTWLQGSDYDIDKAYIMGLAFDDNGLYIGWSSLFDYNDLETIKASEYLPLPKNGVTIEEAQDGIDVSEEAKIITEADAALKLGIPDPKLISQYKTNRILAYVSIFNKLGDNTKVKGASEEIIKTLNQHNATRLPAEIKAQALRNFISVHIQNTILHVRNAADSYVPVDMNDLRDAADDSPKGAESLEITLMNPLSVYTMQYQNMTGKNVIAISATGQKGAFMWMFYLNDTYKNAKLGLDYRVENGEVIPTPFSDLDYARFNFSTSRIAGRSIKGPDNKPMMRQVSTSILPDINTEGIVDPNLVQLVLNGKLKSKIPVDIIISQMISAATDNAKELILAKINAGSKLAKCYLFLMTMGYDINDIVKFMTSNAVSWIDALSDPNIFLGQDLRVDEAITEIEKYLKNYAVNKETDHFEDEFGQETPGSRRKLALIKSIVPSNLTAIQVQEALADIAEFKTVQAGADEFSTFGRLLSINQGLPGKAEDLVGYLSNIKKIITGREKEVGVLDNKGNLIPDNEIKNPERYADIMGGKFDPVRWLLDEEYQKRVAEYYNLIKVSLNIFAIATTLPHFKSMFKLLGGECTVNQFAVKSRILNACLEKISKECPTMYIDDKYYSRILGFASNLMMLQFVVDGNFRFPVSGSVINSNRTISTVKNGLIDLSTEEGIASFKYYFENVVIPGLKAGTYGEWSDQDKETIRYNPFIMSLMRGNDRDVPVWKTNVNISSDSAYTRIQLSKFSKGLNQLQNFKIGEYSLADWFALYNLIVNKNLYGSDRLTKIFENFVKEFDSKGDNLINRYLKYVGEYDYKNGSIDSMMNFTAMDLFISQARIVTSLEGQTDPVVIMYEDKVPKYYKRDGFNYKPMDDILPPVTGESVEQMLHRFYLQRAYFVLGKPYSDILIKTLNLLDDSPIEAIANLMRSSKLLLDVICA